MGTSRSLFRSSVSIALIVLLIASMVPVQVAFANVSALPVESGASGGSSETSSLLMQDDAAYSYDDEDADIVATGYWGTCEWKLDSDGTLMVYPGEGAENTSGDSPWKSYEDKISYIEFVEDDETEAQVKAPKSCKDLLSLSNLESVDLFGLDTSNTTSMWNMFYNCTMLESIYGISLLNTENVNDMDSMFYYCSSLRTLDLSDWIIRENTYTGSMFSGCENLSKITIGVGINRIPSLPEYDVNNNGHTDWYSQNDDKWYTSYEISNRQGIDDIYLKYIPIENASIEFSSNSYAYTGSAITPTPIVKYDANTLELGRDYDIEYYEDNIESGIATVIIEGIGLYGGEAEGSFTIVSSGSNSTSIRSPSARRSLVYNGSLQEGVPSGDGYTLSGDFRATNAGSYIARASLNDSSTQWADGATGDKIIEWSIAKASMSTVRVEFEPATGLYTGRQITPSYSLYLANGAKLESSDYSVIMPSGRVQPGSYEYTFTGRGTNLEGSITSTFTITDSSSAGTSISVPSANTGLVYNGLVRTGVPSGTGYTLSGTSQATNAGSYTATATLTDRNNSHWSDGTTGSKTINWGISPASLSSSSVTLNFSPTEPVAYTGDQVNATYSLMFNNMTLTEGIDYSIAVPDGRTNVGSYLYSFRGMGNFTGSVTRTLEISEPGSSDSDDPNDPYDSGGQGTTTPGQVIVPYTSTYTPSTGSSSRSSSSSTSSTAKKSLSKAKVTLSSKVLTYNGKVRKPKVKVVLNGKRLSSGRDYKVSYSKKAKSVGRHTLKIVGAGSYTGSLKRKYTTIPKTSKITKIERLNNTTSGAVSVSWKKVTSKCCDGYQLQLSTSKSFIVGSIHSANFKAKSYYGKHGNYRGAGLEKSTIHYVRIRVYKKSGGKTYFSPWSKAEEFTT